MIAGQNMADDCAHPPDLTIAVELQFWIRRHRQIARPVSNLNGDRAKACGFEGLSVAANG